MIISMLRWIVRPVFGSFEEEEFKKFLRMGFVFTTLIGSYWTMRTLKKSIFYALVGSTLEPWAKTVSLFVLIPLVAIYSKMVEKYKHERMFYVLSAIYGALNIFFALCLVSPFGEAAPEVLAARTGISAILTQVIAFAWYVFVESYGSLMIALFWAIAASITLPDSAKKGFPMVVALGQLGGIFGPDYITKLPRWLGHETAAISLVACGLFTLSAIVLLTYFFKATPKSLLVSFHGKNEAKVEEQQEPGFFEGLQLMLKHKYLIGMFFVPFFFEFIVTIFDLHFGFVAEQTLGRGHELKEYMGQYGSWVNTVALLSLLLGVSNIPRYLGVSVSLMVLPLVIAGALTGFITINHLDFLFWLMVGSKAINYALNGPTMKLLYIPTTEDVRFKSQAWIETFGSRGSKEGGSLFNMLLGPLVARYGSVGGRAMHAMWSAYIGYGFVVIWLFLAVFLGRTYQKAVDEKRVVC
jgi:ATP:ADP antiporter, AAA family